MKTEMWNFPEKKKKKFSEIKKLIFRKRKEKLFQKKEGGFLKVKRFGIISRHIYQLWKHYYPRHELFQKQYNTQVQVLLSKDRSSHRRCSVKKVFLKISQNSPENTCARVSFSIKYKIKVETLAQVFPCENYEISKNTVPFIYLFIYLII